MAHYYCRRHQQEARPQECYGLRAEVVDKLLAAEVLRALAPVALEVSLRAAEDIEAERARLERHWRQQWEQARYAAERAARQYRAVEPENRLVARALERQWEEALAAEAAIKEDYDRFLSEKPVRLTDAERGRIRALSEDLPALWRSPATTAADRKEVIRCLVERVEVVVRPDSDRAGVTIAWRGGGGSRHEVVRPVRRYAQQEDFGRLKARLGELRRAGDTAAAIAARLNEEGFTPSRRRGPFTPSSVRQLLCRWGLSGERS
jgi:hypothetical protein